MTKTSSRERVLCALDHRQPDRIPVDFGGTFVSGIHVSRVLALRDYFGLGKKPVKVIDPGQFLGEIDEDLKRALGDTPNPPSARMPTGGYFFDAIIRQKPFDEDHLDPADNLEEYGPVSEEELAHLEREARRAAGTGRAVVANFGGTSFGDIALVPGVGLPHPKGIRDITEWYMSTRARRDFVHAVFTGQCEIALANLERIAARLGHLVDVVNICGTDFGKQNSSFCSVATFRELWLPYYRAVNEWVHKNTRWKTFKHSCGAVEKFVPSFVEAGFDILNPVQCSAAGMEADILNRKYGRDLVFWGGGVDTQQVLPFGTPDEVSEQVLGRCEAFYRDGGFVFNTVHNIQARTPVENIIAMIRAVESFNGRHVG